MSPEQFVRKLGEVYIETKETFAMGRWNAGMRLSLRLAEIYTFAATGSDAPVGRVRLSPTRNRP